MWIDLGVINQPLGFILGRIYEYISFGNYGIAIIFFTIFVKIILLPLTLKQQKSMAKQQEIQPELAALQKKYKNDKEKLSEETMKLYKKTGVNPLGGCLPLIVQLPIIISLYQVIRQPVTYIMGINSIEIKEKIVAALSGILENSETLMAQFGNREIEIAQALYNNPGILESIEGISKTITVNFNFLWMNLAKTPSYGMIDILWLIPIFAALSTFLSTKITSSMTPSNNTAAGENKAADTMKSMNMIFPFMTAFFSFSLPAGVGLYWIINNFAQIIQQLILNKIYAPKKDGNSK